MYVLHLRTQYLQKADACPITVVELLPFEAQSTAHIEWYRVVHLPTHEKTISIFLRAKKCPLPISTSILVRAYGIKSKPHTIWGTMLAATHGRDRKSES